MPESRGILIVDDTSENLQVLGDLLEREGYEVRVASNGPDALKAARAVPPDLVLLDIIMPGMDGYEVCRELKLDAKLAQIPVIFISALGMTEHKVGAFREGAVDYITKPFQGEEVAARVRTHLRLRRVEELELEVAARKQAEESIQRSLEEKETLLRELYHRTKNNMEVIISLLGLQAEASGNLDLTRAFSEAKDRIRSMALVHQMLYDAQDLTNVNLMDYITELVSLLSEGHDLANGHISIVYEMEPVYVFIDSAIPCGLVLTELISNALRHAFPSGRRGSLRLGLRRSDDGLIHVLISDDGVGVPPGFALASDGKLGLSIASSLVTSQLGGTIAFDASSGLTWNIEFRDDLYRQRI